jgi:ABC-2 type transport system permease protein
MESAYLFVPGLIAFVLIIITALMTTISLTREKETGTMEVVLVSPLRPVHIIIGKVVPYFALAVINVVTTLTVAWSVFGVPVRGSVALLLAESMLYSLTALAIGAAMAGMLLPTLMLSGFIFPIDSMPRPLQLVTNIVPAKWFVLISRGIMLKGVGLAYLWQETLILSAMTALFLAAAVRGFRIRVA